MEIVGKSYRCECGVSFIGPSRAQSYADHSWECMQVRNRLKYAIPEWLIRAAESALERQKKLEEIYGIR